MLFEHVKRNLYPHNLMRLSNTDCYQCPSHIHVEAWVFAIIRNPNAQRQQQSQPQPWNERMKLSDLFLYIIVDTPLNADLCHCPAPVLNIFTGPSWIRCLGPTESGESRSVVARGEGGVLQVLLEALLSEELHLFLQSS